jgi:hypothetical protein
MLDLHPLAGGEAALEHIGQDAIHQGLAAVAMFGSEGRRAGSAHRGNRHASLSISRTIFLYIIYEAGSIVGQGASKPEASARPTTTAFAWLTLRVRTTLEQAGAVAG